MSDAESIVGRWTAFIAAHQQASGEFTSFSSPSQTDFAAAVPCQTTFITSVILNALAACAPTPVLQRIGRRGAAFLASQKSRNWSFNYWARGTRSSRIAPCPDDWDDTSCALSVLSYWRPDLIGGKALARIVSLLMETETREGGPYRTWLVPARAPKIWRDVDLAVNANIGYFLSLHDITIPNVVRLVEQAIENGVYVSPYYPSPYPILYAIARWYRGRMQKFLIRFLLKRRARDGHWGNPLHTALAISSLMRLGAGFETVEKAVVYLKRMGAREWKVSGFCMDPVRNGVPYYAGSPALTAALCAEALALFHKAHEKQTGRTGAKEKRVMDKLARSIIRSARNRFATLAPDVRFLAHTSLKALTAQDTDRQIALLPAFFRSALEPAAAGRISDALIIELGAVNIFGWLAYRIYDDFFDHEGNSKLLAIANICLRALTGAYRIILAKPERYNQFTCVMDALDAANAWEQLHCRCLVRRGTVSFSALPSYGNHSILADKSLGHALGPLAILLAAGHREDGPEIRRTIAFFKHYLIARQLNDDAHDWLEDISRGFISPAVALILKAWRGSSRRRTIVLRRDVPRLQRIFWHQVITKLAADIGRHVRLARTNLAKMTIVRNPGFLESLLAPVERSAAQALRERERMIEFLKRYKPAS